MDAREVNDPMDKLLNSVDAAETVVVEDKWLEPRPTWLYDFCRDICQHDKLCPQPHYSLCNEIEAVLGDCQFSGLERRGLLILTPRGNYKTTIAAEDLPVGVLVKNPNARILVTAHNVKVAAKRAEAIKAHFERNENFRAVYGDLVPGFREGVWSNKEFLITSRTKVFREPSVTVASLGADMTGSHFDLIVADDLVTPENARTVEQRDKVHEYINSLFSLLDPAGVLVLIGTRWDPDDAYGRISEIDREREKAGKAPLYRKYIRSCYDGPNGLYFPTEYGHKELNDLLDRLKPRRFAANYLNQPVADADKIFKPEFKVERDFVFHQQGRTGGIVRDDAGQWPVDVTFAWDTAGTKPNSSSDYHGLTIRGTDSLNRGWSLVAEEKKGTVTEVIQTVVMHILHYRPRILIMESVHAFELWREKLEMALAKYNMTIGIVESRHGSIPKESRIEMLEPDWCNRAIILKKDQIAFQSQLDNFSRTSKLTHDDVIDSWSMHLGHTETGSKKQPLQVNNPLDVEAIRRRDKNQSPLSRILTGRKRHWR